MPGAHAVASQDADGSRSGGAAIFALALGVRLLYLRQATAYPLHDFVWALADSLYYHRQAIAVSQGHLLGHAAFFLGPLYAYAMGLVYAVVGPSLAAVRLIQAVIGALSCSLLYAIGRRIFDERTGLLAGALLAVYGLHVYYTDLLLPTVLVLFLQLWLVWLLLPRPGDLRLRRAWGAGAVLGLAVLAKSNALLLLPAALAAWHWQHRGAGRRERVAWSFAFVAATLLVVAPATVHNAAASGRFVLVTTSGGRNLWKGNGPHANGTHPLGHWDEDRSGLGKRLWSDVNAEEAVSDSSAYGARTLRYVASHPTHTLRLLGLKLALFFNAVELGVRDQFYFAQRTAWLLRPPAPSFAWIAPLGIAGMLSAWRRRESAALLYALFAVQLVSFVAVFVLARYRIVAAACLVLFAAFQLWLWVDAGRGRRWRAAAPSLIAAAAAALAVNWPIAGFSRERGFALQWQKFGDFQYTSGHPGPAIAAWRQALGSDWQDLDAAAARADTRLRIARAQARMGQVAEARATLARLLAELDPVDARGRAVQADARALAAELGEPAPGGAAP